jgi:tetratricopeptide (TPR) repeat protein
VTVENTSKASGQKFCSHCGTPLTAGAKFCAQCGSAVAGGIPPRLATAPRSFAAAGSVFAGFLIVGGIALYSAQQAARPPERAVSGSPSGGGGPRAAAGATELPPEHPPIALPEEAVKFLEELAAEAKAAPESLDAWQRLARGRYRAALIDPKYKPGAEEALDQVMRLDPANLEALRTRGNLAYDAQDYPAAEKQFVRYLELDPADPGVKTDLASAILFQGNREKAKTLYREVIATHPDFVQAHLNLGIALYADDDRQAADASLREALARAQTPEQKAQVEKVIALAERQSAESGEGDAASPPAAASNATTAFQRDAEAALRGHPIVGPKIAAVQWKGPAEGVVSVRGFPMDAMPPVVRNKFKSRMNEQLSALAQREGVDATLRIELVDADSAKVMDALDGKEWVGAFDENTDQ